MTSPQIDDHMDKPCSGIEISLDSLKWEHRVLVLFSAHSGEEEYQSQIGEFEGHAAGFDDRDLVLFSIFDDECSRFDGDVLTNASARSVHEQIAPESDGFSIYLIGKDGGVKLEQQQILSTKKLFSTIDRMPMRQREMREKGNGSKDA